jgi:hypothetical protein
MPLPHVLYTAAIGASGDHARPALLEPALDANYRAVAAAPR